MRISQIIEKIVEFHPPFHRENTVDVVKCGNAEAECTGIVVTCFASIGVIKKAIELGANFIIVHEPLFWNHEDKTEHLEDSDVFRVKKQLLDEHGIVVWRDHDRMHGEGWGIDRKYVDGMFDGIMRELGWEQALVESELKPLIFNIPETDATGLGKQLQENIGLKGIRIIGDRHAKVSKVFICEHIGGNDKQANEKMLRAEKEGFDALIPLEIVDWNLCAYIRDCCMAGKPKIVYNIGHFNFEELGMRYMAKHLPSLVDGVTVHYIQSGDAFDFII